MRYGCSAAGGRDHVEAAGAAHRVRRQLGARVPRERVVRVEEVRRGRPERGRVLPGGADHLHHRGIGGPTRAEVDLRIEELVGYRPGREHTLVQFRVARHERGAGHIVEQHRQWCGTAIGVRDERVDLGAEPGPDEGAAQLGERVNAGIGLELQQRPVAAVGDEPYARRGRDARIARRRGDQIARASLDHGAPENTVRARGVDRAGAAHRSPLSHRRRARGLLRTADHRTGDRRDDETSAFQDGGVYGPTRDPSDGYLRIRRSAPRPTPAQNSRDRTAGSGRSCA